MNSNPYSFKLLFVAADTFPPFRPDVTVLFGKEIVNRGHVIDLLLQSQGSNSRTYETQWFGCKVLVGKAHDGTSILASGKRHLLSVLHDCKMFNILRKCKYDAILVRDKFISGFTAIIASRLLGTKMIYWLSYPFPEAYLLMMKDGMTKHRFLYWLRGQIFSLLLYKVILRFCDHAFVQTQEMLNNIALRGIPKKKMTPVPMAVAVNEVPFYVYENERKNKRGKIAVYLGTLARNRKLEFLLRSFAKVLGKKNDVKLYLVGGGDDGSDEEFLKREAKRLRINHAVTITGFLPQNEAWRYVGRADVCVSPIYPSPVLNLGSPTKLLEYMAMGKAVVANDHPEQRLVISESKAGICVPYEEDAFAQAILYLLDNPDLARQMGMRGREYIEKKRNYEQTADLVEAKLLQLLASTPC